MGKMVQFMTDVFEYTVGREHENRTSAMILALMVGICRV